MTSPPSLPQPAADQAYCDVSALEAGHLDLPMYYFVDGSKQDAYEPVPSLAFLLQHSVSKKKLVFDLGIRKDTSTLSPAAQQRIKTVFTIRVPQDVVESLQKGGTSPAEIDYVCISHIHWDHIGDPSVFTNATFLSGEGAKALVADGYPTNPHSLFPADIFPEGRTTWLSPGDKAWTPIGPFPRALDFFGDGSLYIVDAAGHLQGHINLLVRTSSDGGWIFLAGDSAHHWSLLTGGKQIASVVDTTGVVKCAHVNRQQAEENIERVKVLLNVPRVKVVLAHDGPWSEANKDGPAYWPGNIPSL